MLTRKLLRLVLVGAVGLAPAACATTRYSRGAVATLPPGVKGKPGSNASIEIEGLKLHIESGDYAKRSEAVPPLSLRLSFEPRELGYSFDPAQVRLRGADGASWAPLLCEEGYRTLAPGSSFGLSFDATLTQGTRLELELAGLARGRRRLDPVRLELVRRNGRSIDRMYWLEAIGVVLLAPVAAVGAY